MVNQNNGKQTQIAILFFLWKRAIKINNINLFLYYYFNCGDSSLKLLPYQLWMVVYRPTMVVTGNGELGFDSGEGAWETATTSKEGSRRANYPILTQGGSDNK